MAMGQPSREDCVPYRKGLLMPTGTEAFMQPLARMLAHVDSHMWTVHSCHPPYPP